MKVKVSVTIPAYNAERYIAESIESVLAQDYPYFEVVIIDDGSTDRTPEIIKKYAKDKRVRIYRQKNKGLGATRNRLIRLAQGKYLSPHDADDIMLAGKLKIQAQYLDKHPKTGLVYGKAGFIDENGKRIKSRDMKKIIGNFYGKDFKKGWDLLFSTVPFPSIMVRKKLLFKVGGYVPTLKHSIDIDILLKLAEITKFHFMNRYFFKYRRHKNNLSRDKKTMDRETMMVKKKAIIRRYGKNKKLFSNRSPNR